MTKPKIIRFGRLTLEDKHKLKNGTTYEHWHYSIDNEHHLHCPDGTLVIFRHEDCEGSVTIKERK